MADFHRHEGWCPLGQPPDGEVRLDVFPEHGDPLPVWRGGDGCSDLDITSDLRADLTQWNRDWENASSQETPGGDQARGQAWLAEGDRLGKRLAAETGAIVVVLGPERSGGAPDCPHCGPDAIDSDDEHDHRVQAARVARFGSPARPTTSAVTMPASGVRLEWRSDGFFRETDADDAASTDVAADDDDWVSWENAVGYGRREVHPGDSAQPTWWLDWGFAAPGDRVSCWLADNTDVPVVRLGWLWIAERVSIAQPMFVSINDNVTEVDVDRPYYLPPAEHPFVRTAPNPRQIP